MTSSTSFIPAATEAAKPASIQDFYQGVINEYNRVLNHAIGLDAYDAKEFLKCWREGHWSGCREFDFDPNESENPAYMLLEDWMEANGFVLPDQSFMGCD